MKYKVGMFGGSFDPLHVGHIHDIIRGASMCENLYVVISWCEGRESTAKELRYRWIHGCTKHLHNVSIIMVEDEAVDKEAYNTDYYWEKGANDIKALIGQPIEVVFCGSDYKGTNRFESLYAPESQVVYFDRNEVPICSTDIRKWAYDNWDYIPKICRSHYVSKVLIVGSESTGKSTLAKNLSLAYNTNYVHEIGRDICEKAGGEDLMIQADFNEILLRHKVLELDAIRESNRILFIDTDAMTTKFYIDFLLSEGEDVGKPALLADAISTINSFDLILFMEPTVEFVQDGTRNETIKSNRTHYSNKIKNLFKAHGHKIHSIDGDYVKRFDKSKALIESVVGINTVW